MNLNYTLKEKVESIDVNDKNDILKVINLLHSSMDYRRLDFHIIKLAQTLGFKVYELNGLETDIGYLFIGSNTEEIYNSNKVIIIDKNLELEQQRYVVANLLAHYTLDYLLEDDRDNKKLYKIKFNETNMNKKADYFAMELLLPKKKFINEYKKITNVAKNSPVLFEYMKFSYLTRYFKVSDELVQKAVNECIYMNNQIEHNDIKTKKLY